jgi:pimeloyl-ACP methyl ester carboxylesterase
MKTALVIHGWPTPVTPDHKLYKFLKDQGFQVIAPYLFRKKKSFSPEDTVRMINKKLGRIKPDVIIGESMGGLIVPYVVKKYPRARLVFVATGPYMDPGSKQLRYAIRLLAGEYGEMLAAWYQRLPPQILSYFYNWDFPAGGGKVAESYSFEIQRNLKNLLEMKPKVISDVARWILVADSTRELRRIQNETLIISSVDDMAMPISLGRKLNKLLVNSKLIQTHGGHSHVLNKNTFRAMSYFIG